MLKRFRNQRGAALLETAITLPLVLLVCVGIFEFGRAFQTWQVITNAAREGARMAVLPGYGDNGIITSRVTAYVNAGRVPTDGGNPAVLVETVSIPVGGGLPAVSARRVTVTYTHTYMFLPKIAGWFGATYNTVPLVAVSEMRTEIVAGS